MTREYDIAFAGSGLAAMSLAVRLIELPDPPRIILIDPRKEFPHDRTWCHWPQHETPFDAAITHRWPQWKVSDSHQSTTVHSANTPYVRIPSDRLNRIALEKLSTSPHVTLLRGTSVQAIASNSGDTTLHLSDGQQITAVWTFDSRPNPKARTPWRQIFRGLELHSSSAHLDTTIVTLMDFQSADPGGIHFFYVLPLDQHTALIEDTWLVPDGQNPILTDEAIMKYARNRLSLGGWQILHREEGCLPMGLISSELRKPSETRTKNRVIPWGTPAGAIRASSGYAFSRIQRASESMSRYWSQHHRPSPNPLHESKLLAWMDRVFLRVMEHHPERVPELFLRMFQRVPPEALVRFLESDPRPADILHLMRALPPAPFLAAALR
jgi:lycopene beta-cyclase